MNKLLFLVAFSMVTSRVSAQLFYEPFDYTAGANLIGQTSAGGQSWTQAGPSPIVNQATVQAGNIDVTGLAASSGNSVKFGGNGTSARFNIGATTTSGTLFYSLAVKLTDITGLSSSGVFWAGFNNSSGTQTTTPTSVGTRIVTKTSGAGFQIGLDKASGSAANFVFDPTVFNVNDTIFVVGSYTFNTGTTTDDQSQLWVNPSSPTFGAASAPSATLTATAGTDLSGLASFVLFNRSTAEPAGVAADELRVGAAWADVTPTAVPEPHVYTLVAGLGLLGFAAYRQRVSS